MCWITTAISQSFNRKLNANYGFWNYAKNFTYTAAGAVTSMQLGNGRWESTHFNNRLQPTQIALGMVQNGTDKLKLDFEYGTLNTGTGQVINGTNNGNVAKQTITVTTETRNNVTYGSFSATQYYVYDSLNRIKIASENLTPNGQSTYQSWMQTFTYDRYGNRNFDEANTTTLPKNCGTSPNFTVCTADKKILNPSISTSNNRIIQDQDGDSQDDYLFDTAGNTTKDAQGRTFIYDAENKQIEVKDSQNQTIGKYFYDGDGKRVKKYVPSTGETTVFVYNAGGQLVAEYSTQISQQPQVSYLTTDHLGSPRINTDANGTVTARHDYQPFGEEIQRASYGADAVRKQFATYERDRETDLDFAQARYFNSGIGRFSSPDSFTNDTRVSDPQSWNLYVYTRNNPLNMIDPLGTKATVTSHYDEETGITTIRIKASFAVYGAKGQNVSEEDKAKYAALLVKGIKGGFDGGYVVDGKGFIIETDIDVQVTDNEEAAIASGADNLVALGTDLLGDGKGNLAYANVFSNSGENFDRMNVSINAPELVSSFSPANYEKTFAHEFAHLLGVSDTERAGMFNSAAPAARMTETDFAEMFGERSELVLTSPPPLSNPDSKWITPSKKPSVNYTRITRLEGSKILNSTSSSFEIRRTGGANVYKWVKRVKN